MEIIMSSPKAEVASMLEALADDVDFEDIQYHLYVLEKVNRGLERVEIEGAVPHEEVKKRLNKWLVG
jgi:predicted transcriptional regulator